MKKLFEKGTLCIKCGVSKEELKKHKLAHKNNEPHACYVGYGMCFNKHEWNSERVEVEQEELITTP